MFKKAISLLLIFVLMCSIFLTHSNLASAKGNTSENLKLSSDLLEAMGITYEQLLSDDFEDSGDSYSCIIWAEDIDMTVAVEAGIDAAEKTRATYIRGTSYEYPYTVMEIDGTTIVDVDLAEDESDLYVQTYIENERAMASELYVENNLVLLKELIENDNVKINYVSSYSPCIFADLTITAISELILMDNIKRIGYWGEEKLSDESGSNPDEIITQNLDLALDIIEADTAQTNYNVTGEGVVIGQIESGCPRENSVIIPSDLNRSSNGTTHADNVYTIMHAVAPNATYYSNISGGTNYANIPARIEWLLEQGVNIINMSASYEVPNSGNKYNSLACWIDHIAYNHDVHFVTISGNYIYRNQNDIVNSVMGASMGYNVITVGNTLMTRTNENLYYDLHEKSLYNQSGANSNGTYKPDVCAPGTYNDESFGTSYSAPLVTGTIALMCEYQPSLKTKQHIVKAILAASTSKTAGKYETSHPDFKKFGAGIVDARSALWIISRGRYTTTTGTLSASVPTKSYDMVVTSSDSVMRIALAYANKVKFTSSNHNSMPETFESIGEIELHIKSPNGTIIRSCVVDGANLKVVEFTVANYGYGTGTYTIEVKQTASSSTGTINFGLAWR